MSHANQVLTDAVRSSAFRYGKGRAIQCNLCDEWLYTQERSASSEYDVLTTHLVDSHPEIHDELVERYQNSPRY